MRSGHLGPLCLLAAGPVSSTVDSTSAGRGRVQQQPAQLLHTALLLSAVGCISLCVPYTSSVMKILLLFTFRNKVNKQDLVEQGLSPDQVSLIWFPSAASPQAVPRMTRRCAFFLTKAERMFSFLSFHFRRCLFIIIYLKECQGELFLCLSVHS